MDKLGKHTRTKKGSLLFLAVAIVFLLIAVMVFAARFFHLLVQKQRHQQAAEAAALKAASDLSEIVINDPYFGFVSLTDRPAIGRATVALDGEPLPVHGINTLIATSRLDYIIANELDDDRLIELAFQDVQKAREAAARLDSVLVQSLKPRDLQKTNSACDMDGNEINPYADALKIYEQSLSTVPDSEEFKLRLGWLSDGGETITPAALSDFQQSKKRKYRYVSQSSGVSSPYRAYIDIPLGSEHFSFFSLGLQPRLVNSEAFVPRPFNSIDRDLGDLRSAAQLVDFNLDKYNPYFSSIVNVQSTWLLPNLFSWDNTAREVCQESQASAQPYAIEGIPSPTVLLIAFPDGLPSGMYSLRDMFSNAEFNQTPMHVSTPLGGDYPPWNNEVSALIPQKAQSARWVFAVCFQDWLRSNGTLPKIDSVLNMLNQSLMSISETTSPIFVIEIDSKGNATASPLLRDPFPTFAIEENQLYASINEPVILNGGVWSIECRDEMHTLGTIAGGKHAGQPLAGDPINWDELSSFVEPALTEVAVSRKPGGILVAGRKDIDGGIAFLGAQLQSKNGEMMDHNLRTSTYSTGLAAEIRLSHPRRPLR